MQDSLIIYEKNNAIVCAGFNNNRLNILNVEENSNPYKVGNIYVGHVSKIILHLNAAYIDIGMKKLCYMELDKNNFYNSDKLHPDGKLHVGDDILVQIIKDSNGSKPVSVSSELSITGRYVVVSYKGKSEVGVSSKISDTAKRKALKDELNILTDNKYSIIARTSCADAELNIIIEEFNKIKITIDSLIENGNKKVKSTLLYSSEPGYLNSIKDMIKSHYDRIVTDSPDIYLKLKDFVSDYNISDIPVEFYSDKVLPLENLYDMRKNLSELIRERVWLKSGAHIVIQKTEALYTIDVNSSKSSSDKKNFKSGFMDINLEAAREIYRQIRLRNISGIIIIDFINMKGCDSVNFLNDLKSLYKEDTTIQVVDITKLGLVEVTRLRRKQPVTELIIKYNLAE